MAALHLIRAACSAAFAILLLAAQLVAATIHVPGDQPTIQAGIDAASTGDTVLVAPGFYSGAGNRDLNFGGRDLVLMSEAGPLLTSIDPQGVGRGLVFQGGETGAAVVEGFTIQNGLAAGAFGGGILIAGGATPTIRECRFVANHANAGGAVNVTSGATLSGCEFEENTADNYGGGVYGAGASLSLAECGFVQNGAGFGGGVYVISGSTAEFTDCSFTENEGLNLAGGVYGSASTLTLRGCSFVGQTAKLGAGVHLLDGTASVDSCTFSLNTADYAGGGMYAEHVDALAVTRCRFESNVTLDFYVGLPSGGGGLHYVAPDPPATAPYIADCTFVLNRAQSIRDSGGRGGGLKGGGFETLMERCTFVGNHGDNSAGGAYFRGRAHGCVFEGNTTGGFGGGLYGSGAHELIECRFIDNRSDEWGGGCYQGSSTAYPASVTRCEFSGNWAPNGGGLAFVSHFGPLTMTDSRFTDNIAGDGGGMKAIAGAAVSISGCTFERNTAFRGGAADINAGQNVGFVTLSACTLVGNGAPNGGCLAVDDLPVAVENAIIAFGTEGEPVSCEDEGVATVSCTDVHGNAGGDWTGCIGDQLGVNGNFSADPLFCNAGAGDYTLAETSPCAPEHSPAGCGLIGAFPVACVNPIGVAVETAPRVVGRLRVTPNPMRGSGTIEWVNEHAGAVSLRLYDPLGRLVTIRSLGLMPGGRQELRWDGLLGERGLPPGVYLLELGGPSGGGDRARVILIR